MAQFHLDTSGLVLARAAGLATSHPHAGTNVSWSDLSPFTQGYIEAMLSEPETARAWWLRHSGPFGIPAAAPFRDLAPETLARIMADCEARVRPIVFDPAGVWMSSNEGRLFWEQRQDGVYGDLPPLTVQLGDDGKVRFA